ncbi:MAG: hypothetical protein AAF500_10080 [Myxococcota bacterium]
MHESRKSSFTQLRGRAAPNRPIPWTEICRDATWQGQWVALDDCAYNEAGEATSGLVVDHDDNLTDLCARLSGERRKHCSVVFCPPAESAA